MANELEVHPTQNPSQFDLLLARYAGGTMMPRDLSRATGRSFGEILGELGKGNLALPRDAQRRTPVQDSLLKRAPRGAE